MGSMMGVCEYPGDVPLNTRGSATDSPRVIPMGPHGTSWPKNFVDFRNFLQAFVSVPPHQTDKKTPSVRRNARNIDYPNPSLHHLNLEPARRFLPDTRCPERTNLGESPRDTITRVYPRFNLT